MKQKLETILERYRSLNEELSDPEIGNDLKRFKTVSREYKQLTPLAEAAEKYIKICNDISSS